MWCGSTVPVSNTGGCSGVVGGAWRIGVCAADDGECAKDLAGLSRQYCEGVVKHAQASNLFIFDGTFLVEDVAFGA